MTKKTALIALLVVFFVGIFQFRPQRNWVSIIVAARNRISKRLILDWTNDWRKGDVAADGDEKLVLSVLLDQDLIQIDNYKEMVVKDVLLADYGFSAITGRKNDRFDLAICSPLSSIWPWIAYIDENFANGQGIRGWVGSAKPNLNRVGHHVSSANSVNQFSFASGDLHVNPLLHPCRLDANAIAHCLGRFGAFSGLLPYGHESQSAYQYQRPVSPFNSCMGFWRFLGGGICLCLVCGIVYHRNGLGWNLVAAGLLLAVVFFWVAGRENCQDAGHREVFKHDGGNVAHGTHVGVLSE